MAIAFAGTPDVRNLKSTQQSNSLILNHWSNQQVHTGPISRCTRTSIKIIYGCSNHGNSKLEILMKNLWTFLYFQIQISLLMNIFFFPFEMHCNSMGQYQIAFSIIKKKSTCHIFQRESMSGYMNNLFDNIIKNNFIFK